MPYDLSRKEEGDKYFGEKFSSNRIQDVRNWIRRNGAPDKLAKNEAARNTEIHINDLYAEFGAGVEAQRRQKNNGLLRELREYRANGVVPVRVEEGQGKPWRWKNTGPGGLDQVRCMIYRKYVLKEGFFSGMIKKEGTVRHQPVSRKPKDPNAPQRKIVRKGATKGVELDEAAVKLQLRKEREKRNEERFAGALQEAISEHNREVGFAGTLGDFGAHTQQGR